MKKKIFFILLGVLLIAIIFIFLMDYSIIKISKNKIVNLKICNDNFLVELAETEAVQRKGLSKRKSLGEKEGMLFLFDKPDVRHFWMKDMNFSLDIVWINGDKIIGVKENLEPAAEGKDSVIYSSSAVVDKVLEIKAGAFKKTGANIFDKTVGLNNDCGSKIEIL